jgi:hypothetical protein
MLNRLVGTLVLCITATTFTATTFTATAFTATLCFAASGPRGVTIAYTASMNGLPIASIDEQFEAKNGTYRLESSSNPVGVLALFRKDGLKLTSSGNITGDGLQPLQFQGVRGVASEKVSAEFDWKAAKITLTNNGQPDIQPLSPGTQDRVSIMYQFMYLDVARRSELAFAMTNGRKLDNYRYAVTRDVELDTPLGKLITLHLVKEREANDPVTEIWLSRDHRYLPVKVLIVENNGARYEQMVQRVDIRP